MALWNEPQPSFGEAGDGGAGPQIRVTRVQPGPYSEVSSFTITSGKLRTFRSGGNLESDDLFQGPEASRIILVNLPNPHLNDQEGFVGPGHVGLDFPNIPHHLLSTILNPNAVRGDVVQSQEVLDRITTSLMEANPQSNAAPPASRETIAKLPRKKLDEKMLGPEPEI